MLAEIYAPLAWARLHWIEHKIVESLAAQPLDKWCDACHYMIRKIYEKTRRRPCSDT